MRAYEVQTVLAICQADGDFDGRRLVDGSVLDKAAADLGVFGVAGVLVHGGAGRAEGKAVLISGQ
jgi:hypothetical protein